MPIGKGLYNGKFGLYLLLTLGATFILFVVFSLIIFEERKKEFPDIELETELKDTIVTVIPYGTAGAFATFRSGRKYELPFTSVNGAGNSLSRTARNGDILIKNPNSDTIRLIRSGDELIFVGGVW